MTIKEYQKKLDRRIKEFSFTNKDIYLCVADTHSEYTNRIFRNGRRSNLSRIGSYSKGYQDKRKAKGLIFNSVNFVFNGTLETDVRNSLTVKSKGVVVSGVKNIAPKNPDPKRKGITNSEKIDKLINQYGEDVWELSKIERKKLSKCLAAQSIKIITK